MSPTLAQTQFRPKMKRYTSSIWNNVRRYEGGATWLPEAREEIARLEQLEDNWDSYGSLRIQPVAVKNAIRFMFDIPARLVPNIPKPTIAPVPGGGIGFHWRMGGRDLEIEFTPAGEVEFLKSYPGTDRESIEGIIEDKDGSEDFNGVLKWAAGLM